ncbi:hypothetical protein CI610_03179 [invertebrate metagenome]|uniref:Uncharacterized protein n=1 Tax=invertebrate metagenome TaxID=1711999 RepID=A0A2H9T3V0_9ZZZZ
MVLDRMYFLTIIAVYLYSFLVMKAQLLTYRYFYPDKCRLFMLSLLPVALLIRPRIIYRKC